MSDGTRKGMRDDEPTPDQLDRLADYLGDAMDAAVRRDFENELLADPVLARVLYEELGVEGQLSSAGDAAATRPGRSPAPRNSRARRWWWTVPVAAAAVLALLFLPNTQEPGPPAFRGEGTPLEVVGPTGRIAGPSTVFRWRLVPGANYYQVEIFDAQALRRFDAATGDTFLRVGPPLPETGGPGFWRVTALDSLAAPLATSAPVSLDTTR